MSTKLTKDDTTMIWSLAFVSSLNYRQAKITQFRFSDISVFQKNVCRFQISVNDTSGVEIVHAFADASENFDLELGRNGLFGHFLNDGIQVSSFDEFGHLRLKK